MSRLGLLALLSAVAAIAVHAQSVTGDWQGTLVAGPRQIPLILHFTADGATLKGAMDSPDQGANGIPMTSVTLKGAKLEWSIEAAHVSYDGTVTGDQIRGTFTQGQAFPLDFKRMAAAPPVKPSDIDGAWMGTLDVGAMKLRLAFHFTTTASGLTASLDSLDQNANGIPVKSAVRTGDTLKLDIPAIRGSFEGKINAARDTIEGTFTQAAPLPLVLKHAKSDADLLPKRPQNPVKPYPYREEDAVYENPSAGVKLAATFTIPSGKGPFPAVLLITGSGPQDRDESLMGHKPFLVFSDYLTRHGIAVLRADDRGIAKSTGNFATATTADFATDAEAGVAWLKTRPEVNKARIGLAGHSEGGTIAAMVAARNRDVGFIVMLAGSAVRGEDVVVAQVMAMNEAGGMSHDEAVKTGVMERDILKLVEGEKDLAKLKEKLATYLPKQQVDAEAATLDSPWYRFFLEYDPGTALRKVTCPVLALDGSKDTQVVARQNLPVIRESLTAGGNKHFEVVEMPGLNHLFQTAKTGAATEYGSIEETMSPAVLEKVAGWIRALQ